MSNKSWKTIDEGQKYKVIREVDCCETPNPYSHDYTLGDVLVCNECNSRRTLTTIPYCDKYTRMWS